MKLDHLGELLVGLEPLPFQARPPVVEEAPRPALALAFSELAKGLLEQVGSVQALVGRQELLEVLAGRRGQVRPVRQPRVLLALDEMSSAWNQNSRTPSARIEPSATRKAATPL